MQLVEQHVISKCDPRYAVIDAAAFASKNLYNATLYETRQAYIHEGRSSRFLHQELSRLETQMPALRTNSYFVATDGGVALEKLKYYVEGQKGK